MNGRRAYSSPLRREHVADTRDRILDAFGALVEVGGEPTYAAIAEEARVQERTVYRHFPSKSELYAAFWDHHHARDVPDPMGTQDLDGLRAAITASFTAFGRHSRLIQALLHSPAGRGVRMAPNDARREMFERVVRSSRPDLHGARLRRAAAATQVLYSAMSWEYLSEYWQMDTAEAVTTVTDAVSALLNGIPHAATRRREKDA